MKCALFSCLKLSVISLLNFYISLSRESFYPSLPFGERLLTNTTQSIGEDSMDQVKERDYECNDRSSNDRSGPFVKCVDQDPKTRDAEEEKRQDVIREVKANFGKERSCSQ